MDHFGIGAALLGAAQIYFRSARGTGRTTPLIESVRDGDRTVVSTSREECRVKELLAERGLKVAVLAVNPDNPGRLFEVGTSEGRTIFDHTWVEQYYLQTLERASSGLDHLQRESSGFGTAHYETKRKAEEAAKWRPYCR